MLPAQHNNGLVCACVCVCVAYQMQLIGAAQVEEHREDVWVTIKEELLLLHGCAQLEQLPKSRVWVLEERACAPPI